MDMFILETLGYFVDSLKLAHVDEKTIGSRELCCRALDNILRIVSVKSALLSGTKSQRRWPFDNGESRPVTLSLAVEWLLFQTSCPQSDCRRKCMELAWTLVPRLPGSPTHSSYMAELLRANGSSFFVERFEEGLSATTGTWSSLMGIRKFCDQLLGLLECYTWILEQQLLEPKLLFEVPNKPSFIFPLITKFLERLALCENLHEALSDDEAASLFCTPTGTSAFNLAKCSVTVRLFNFLAVWMKSTPSSMSAIPEPFWKTGAFWKCCVVCVLLPSEAGFDLSDLEVSNQLPLEMLGFLRQVSGTFPDLLSSSFASALSDFLAKRPECSLEKLLDMDIDELNCPPGTLELSQAADVEPMDEDPKQQQGQKDVLRLTGLVSGYRLLAELNIVKVDPELSLAPVRAVARFLGRQQIVSPTPLTKELCLHLLELATALGASASKILESLEPTRAWDAMGDQLCHHFIENARTFVPASLSVINSATAILTRVLNHVLQDNHLASMHGSTLSSELMKQWSKLAPFFDENSAQTMVNSAVLVLEKLVLLNPEIVSPKSPHFETLFALFLNLLQRPAATLVDKVLALGLVSAFAHEARQEASDRLRDALEEMVLQHFPMEVSKLLPGAPELLGYVQAMRKLLAGLESTGSTVLLELLLRVLYREDKSHFLEPEVLHTLRRTVPRSSEAKQQQLLNTAYKCAAILRGLPTSARLSIASRLLPQLLRHSSKSSLQHFFVDNVGAIADVVASKIRSGSEWELTSKIVALSCLEVLYSCSPKDVVSGKQSAINSAFCRARGITAAVGNELTKEVTKHTNMLKKERGELGSSEADVGLWRRLRCAAYNVIMAVVSCTQVDAKFYYVFLFQENPHKGEFVWNNITEELKVYNFPLVIEAPYRKNRQIVGVTEEVLEGGSQHRSPRQRTLSSLQGSSLAKEASQYSLSASGLVSRVI